MPRIDRIDLERSRSSRSVMRLLREFEADPGAYSDEEIYSRAGVIKVLLEEYYPLSALARHLRGIRSIRLMPASNKGPDAQIRSWCGYRNIQITCADQSYQEALLREDIRSHGIGFAFQQRRRDRQTGQVIAEGRGLASAEANVVGRIDQIRDAIERKRTNQGNADVLLVSDAAAHWEHLRRADFLGRVRQMFTDLEPVPYREVYICFRDEIVQLK